MLARSLFQKFSLSRQLSRANSQWLRQVRPYSPSTQQTTLIIKRQNRIYPPNRHLRPFRLRQVDDLETPLRRISGYIWILRLTYVRLPLAHLSHRPLALPISPLARLTKGELNRHDAPTPRQRTERERLQLHEPRSLPDARERRRLHRTRRLRRQPLRHERQGRAGRGGTGPGVRAGHRDGGPSLPSFSNPLSFSPR